MSELQQAINAYLEAKQAENVAKERRYAAEKEISRLVGYKDEGQLSESTGSHKVTVRYRVNRRIDMDKFDEIRGQLPPAIAKNLIRSKPKLDMKGYRWLRENRPELFALVSTAITSKPGKPGVRVEEL